ncbi:MAG: prepilin-type N-terminal cleavage/methylation domain-containing protein [Sulfurovum sp.]|nr:prepilin-type N-terminal cleavage/methylation domain-containing protein [Sulfurovum sp.]
MLHIKNSTRRKGFTLIELLIVILIVGMVYMLGFSDIEMGEKHTQALTPLNLKSVITTSESFQGQVSLLCTNKCTKCYLRRSIASPYADYESGINLTGIKAYTIDNNDALVPIEYERYKDQKICLKIDFYPNGSSTQIILEDTQGSYFLPSYFDDATGFDSIEDAKEHWLTYAELVSNNGAFY